MGKRVIEIKSKSGTIYLYEDESYWDKERGYSTHKRTCIGKKGSDGSPIYNTYYKTREEMRQMGERAKKPVRVSRTTLVGERMVFDKTIRNTSIFRILR